MRGYVGVDRNDRVERVTFIGLISRKVYSLKKEIVLGHVVSFFPTR